MENKGIRMIEIQEYERKRIAMDLHDTTVHVITSYSIHYTKLYDIRAISIQ